MLGGVSRTCRLDDLQMDRQDKGPKSEQAVWRIVVTNGTQGLARAVIAKDNTHSHASVIQEKGHLFRSQHRLSDGATPELAEAGSTMGSHDDQLSTELMGLLDNHGSRG
jgi:hypothetical protein